MILYIYCVGGVLFFLWIETLLRTLDVMMMMTILSCLLLGWWLALGKKINCGDDGKNS